MSDKNRIDIKVGIKLDSNLPRPIIIESVKQYRELYGSHASFTVTDVTPIPLIETTDET